MRGRKPSPTALLKAKGTFDATRHGRDRRGEPIAEGDISEEPPETLSRTQAAIWRYAVQTAPKGILKRADHHTFLAWVVAADQHEQARVAQAKLDDGDGPPLLVQNGSQLIPSPYLRIMHRTHLRMMKAASELGFSPASRPRLATGQAPEKPDVEWDELRVINGGKSA
jgi:P27 family predicted phage terminase small subunit